LINEKGKLFGIVNPIDVVAVLGVIAAAAVLVWFFIGGNIRADFDRYIYYTVEVRFSDEELAHMENISIGDELRDTIFGVEIGTVVDVQHEPQTEWVLDRINQRLVEVEMPGYVRLLVTIRSLGRDNGRALEIMSPGYEMRLGREVHFRGRGYQAYGFVVYMSEVRK